jgi:hypothetical protein
MQWLIEELYVKFVLACILPARAAIGCGNLTIHIEFVDYAIQKYAVIAIYDWHDAA